MNNAEHKALVEYLRVNEQAVSIEHMEVYFQGHADCMATAKIGIL